MLHTLKRIRNRASAPEVPAPLYREDPALIDACVRGDANAWNEFVERYARLVYSVPRRLGFSAQDADDVFQTVFGIVLRSLASLRDQSRVSAWLLRTTYRECWRFRRSNRATADKLPEVADAGLPTDDEVALRERQHLVRKALARLDGRCRELLEALFFDKDSPAYDAIAQRLGIPIGSIGPTRGRCFKKLETILGEYGL